MTETITIQFEGRAIAAQPGETLAAALTAAGIRHFRTTRSGAPRGLFCGMGVCQDCLVEIDGRPNQRACMAKVDRPMQVRRESDSRALPARTGRPPVTIGDVPVETPEILVVGAGPGGLAAAIAARRCGAEVVVVDERSGPGGQYFKQLSVQSSVAADGQHWEGRTLIDQAISLGVQIRSRVSVWGAFEPLELAASSPAGPVRFQPQRLIVATGAYERGVPLPGWTLPGVMTTGAAQTLWRTSRRLPGRRVLIAGNGPLNLQLAAELLDGGGEVVAVAEAANAPGPADLRAALTMAVNAPELLRDGLRYRAGLLRRGVPLVSGSVVEEIRIGADGLGVRLRATPPANGKIREFQADAVCLGYGFEPSNELLRALGAAHSPRAGSLAPRLDERGRTSVAGVFAIGDCTGLGGARAALAAGAIAGITAAADLGRPISAAASRDLARAERELARQRRFQAALWSIYRAPRLGLDLARPDTTICRCEEVTAADIEDALREGHASIGAVKRRSRAGMGRCQGRYCGPLVDSAIAAHHGREPDEFSGFAPRVPFKPVAIRDLIAGGEG